MMMMMMIVIIMTLLFCLCCRWPVWWAVALMFACLSETHFFVILHALLAVGEI